MGTIVLLKKVRLGFTKDLFEPSQFEGKGDHRFSTMFIVTPGSESDKLIQAAIVKEAQGVWNKKADVMLEELRGDKKNFAYQKNKRGSNGEMYEGCEGNYALSANRKQKDGAPIFMHIQKDPDTGKPKILTGKEGIIYAGCYVNAKVEMWAQAGKYNGMRCGLLGVQFCDHGDSFGGASRPTDDGFDSIDAEDDLA
jgi:hypothetical protein